MDATFIAAETNSEIVLADLMQNIADVCEFTFHLLHLEYF